MRIGVNFGDFPSRFSKTTEFLQFTKSDIMQLTNDDLRFLYSHFWKNSVAEFARNYQVTQLKFVWWLEKRNSCPTSETAVRSFLTDSGLDIPRALEQNPTMLQLAVLMGCSKVARFLAEDLGADILGFRIRPEDTVSASEAKKGISRLGTRSSRRSPSPWSTSHTRSSLPLSQQTHVPLQSHRSHSSHNHSPTQNTHSTHTTSPQLTGPVQHTTPHHCPQQQPHFVNDLASQFHMQEQDIQEGQDLIDQDQISPILLDMSPLVVAVNKGHTDIVKMLLNLLEQRKEQEGDFFVATGEAGDPTKSIPGGRYVQCTGTKTLLPASFKPHGIYIDDEFCALSCESSSEEEEITLEHAEKEGNNEDEDSTSNEEGYSTLTSDINANASTTVIITDNNDDTIKMSRSGKSNTPVTSINDNDNNDMSSIPTKYLLQLYNKGLLQAVSNGQEVVAQQLLDRGADPNFPGSPLPSAPPLITSPFSSATSSYSCLSLSIQRQLLNMVRLLLGYGANPLLPDPLGRSPIHMASKFGENNDIFKILINKISSM